MKDQMRGLMIDQTRDPLGGQMRDRKKGFQRGSMKDRPRDPMRECRTDCRLTGFKTSCKGGHLSTHQSPTHMQEHCRNRVLNNRNSRVNSCNSRCNNSRFMFLASLSMYNNRDRPMYRRRRIIFGLIPNHHLRHRNRPSPPYLSRGQISRLSMVHLWNSVTKSLLHWTRGTKIPLLWIRGIRAQTLCSRTTKTFHQCTRSSRATPPIHLTHCNHTLPARCQHPRGCNNPLLVISLLCPVPLNTKPRAHSPNSHQRTKRPHRRCLLLYLNGRQVFTPFSTLQKRTLHHDRKAGPRTLLRTQGRRLHNSSSNTLNFNIHNHNIHPSTSLNTSSLSTPSCNIRNLSTRRLNRSICIHSQENLLGESFRSSMSSLMMAGCQQ